MILTRRALLAGDVIVRAMEASRNNGRPIEVPSARVEHWLGAVLIPGITAARLVDALEIADANTPQEHQVRADNDRGFLWRLNAYWRYQDVAGGVVAECESLTLSRDVPSVVRFLVNPVIERTARESMTRTLAALRTRFGTADR